MPPYLQDPNSPQAQQLAKLLQARGMMQDATFSLFVRRLPKDRGFLVAAGLEPALTTTVPIVGGGGQASACGWCKDRWGVSWQITPTALTDAMADRDPAVVKRVFDAMMRMGKIDIAAIEAARRG